jgi:hypothetical protein
MWETVGDHVAYGAEERGAIGPAGHQRRLVEAGQRFKVHL